MLLHLTLLVLKTKFPNYKKSLLCIYIENTYPFLEIQDFINKMAKYYNLNMTTVIGTIKESLQTLNANKPNVKACLMGTRRTDPFSMDLNTFQVPHLVTKSI